MLQHVNLHIRRYVEVHICIAVNDEEAQHGSHASSSNKLRCCGRKHQCVQRSRRGEGCMQRLARQSDCTHQPTHVHAHGCGGLDLNCSRGRNPGCCHAGTTYCPCLNFYHLKHHDMRTVAVRAPSAKQHELLVAGCGAPRGPAEVATTGAVMPAHHIVHALTSIATSSTKTFVQLQCMRPMQSNTRGWWRGAAPRVALPRSQPRQGVPAAGRALTSPS